jgi:hypothetical protein
VCADFGRGGGDKGKWRKPTRHAWLLVLRCFERAWQGLGYRFPPLAQYTPSFVAWVMAVAERYKGKVVMYEFWNEENGCSWVNDGCSNGDSAPTYAPWLCTWAAAMRKADPGARLSVGGLDYNAGVSAGYQCVRRFQQADSRVLAVVVVRGSLPMRFGL